MTTSRKSPRSNAGFTLIELLAVVLIIAILASIAVPQDFKVVEKGKAAESLTTLDSIRNAQERYLAKSGQYCGTALFGCTGWDMPVPTLKYFTVGTPTQNASPGWSLTLTRNGSPGNYGAYTVTYTVNPGVQPSVTCSCTACQNDLMPQ
jgi:prepilin-type N-terminal cleavage/methylation domain-containing protein